MIKTKEYAHLVLKLGIIVAIIIVLSLGISAFAGDAKINNVKIKFSNNHEITVITSKTKVSEILDENHIMIASNEKVEPSLDEEISSENLIKISLISAEEEAKPSQTVEENVSLEDIAQEYENIAEEIITVQEEIPYETITKDVSEGASSTADRILQAGKNGIKETTYKVKYKNGEEIERTELSSKVIKEPVNKIVQVQKKVTSRSASRNTGSSGKSGIYKVTAYCSCAKCCGKTNGITASGTHATAGRTIATPSTFAFGTKVIINGHEYTVEDRGGAIQGNRIDIYMNSHQEAIAWGVRYLEAEVVE